MKALQFLAASDVAMEGKPAGWAAGIIYALANRDKRACGVPGLLNREVEEFFDVLMSTVRKRAAQVERALEIWIIALGCRFSQGASRSWPGLAAY
jgi:hypothetical protein